MRWFLNLKAGLDELGVAYVVNDYRSLRKHPGTPALVIGKDHVLEKIPEGHPIIFGPGVASHPHGNPYWKKKDIRLLLISCDWFAKMYERDLPVKIPVRVWAAGIQTDIWRPPNDKQETKKILIYDKVRWEHEKYEETLLKPIREKIKERGYKSYEIKYLFYKEEDYLKILKEVDAMIFLCEHETQGFAYLQALSCDVPIMAWDRGGFWQDPSYYPNKVKFAPVTSVPYWDQRCGLRFRDFREFAEKFDDFTDSLKAKHFAPRNYVKQILNLADKARLYMELIQIIKTVDGKE